MQKIITIAALASLLVFATFSVPAEAG